MKKETDGVEVLRKLLADNHWDWANWTICQMFTPERRVKYAVHAAELVEDKWKDKSPAEYAIWRKWVDDGCPGGERARAEWAAARAAAYAAVDAAAYAAVDAAERAARAASAAASAALKTKIIEYGISFLEASHE